MGAYCSFFVFFALCYISSANLWRDTGSISDIQAWRTVFGQHPTLKEYLEESNMRITVFAPIDKIFTDYPQLRSNGEQVLLAHIVNAQLPELSETRKWKNETIVRKAINGGNVYITQMEKSPGHFIYFVNNGLVCPGFQLMSGEQYLYKLCSPIGHRPYPGTALSFVQDRSGIHFNDRLYSNDDLTDLRDVLERSPDIALALFGQSERRGDHTFFLPNNKAFSRFIDRNRVDREILLAHITAKGFVVFTKQWMEGGEVKYFPSVKFSSNILEDYFKLMLVMRNITDDATGKHELYAVSQVYEPYAHMRRGSVWSKIVVPNIPVENGVVHIVDSVLGLVTETVDQMVMRNPNCFVLTRYLNQVGEEMRNLLASADERVTFFAPSNAAFNRIPEEIERRMLKDRSWLEEILRLHIVVNKELTSDEINNQTTIYTIDNKRQLNFAMTEHPEFNISYYVIGGGVRARIVQDNVAAVNGIVHYIDRVMGIPYETLWAFIKDDSRISRSYEMLSHLNLKYTLDPPSKLTTEQQMTFFVPTNEAWEKIPPSLLSRMNDGKHWLALQFVYKRHIIQGESLMFTDLRDGMKVMMNGEDVVIRSRGRSFELYWARGNRVARLIEGGQIAGINGFIHLIDNVLIYEPDLRATSSIITVTGAIFILLLSYLFKPKVFGFCIIHYFLIFPYFEINS